MSKKSPATEPVITEAIETAAGTSTRPPEKANETAGPHREVEPRLPRPPKRKKRWGDRKDGRRVRTVYAMNKFMPFIMKDRADAQNYFADELDVTEADAFCKQMIADGYEGFSFLHLMLAAYVRTVSQKPALNRFISGQRI